MVAEFLGALLRRALGRQLAGGGRRRDGREGGRDGGDGRRRGALLDAEFHVAGDEDEDVLDLALWMGGLEQNVPGEVAGGRIHLVERRRRLDVDRDLAVAERPQFVEQQQRIAAVDEHVLVEAHADPPRLRLRRRRGGRGRGGFGRDAGERRDGAWPLNQLAQVRQNAHADDRVRLFRLLDLRAQKVLGVERDRDQVGLWGGVALAHPIECALELVGERGDLIEAEHRPRALDGVQGAKGAVDQVAVVGRALKIEQRRLQLFEQFARFLAEDFDGVGVIGHPSNFSFTSIN